MRAKHRGPEIGKFRPRRPLPLSARAVEKIYDIIVGAPRPAARDEQHRQAVSERVQRENILEGFSRNPGFPAV